jgi:hypothetical protein
MMLENGCSLSNIEIRCISGVETIPRLSLFNGDFSHGV